MRPMLIRRLALLLSALAVGILEQIGHAQTGAIKEGFEGKNLDKDIDPRFELCYRPENSFRFSPKARSGRQSLEIKITPQPLFAKVPRATEALRNLNPQHCLQETQESTYWSDDLERAELWQDKDQSPKFGEGDALYYGFSMWVDAKGVPKGDFNRLVLGQWKAACKTECDGSPFLAQRLTGRFYHITLDVDAHVEKGGARGPKTCKILLAFSKDPPSRFEKPLALDRPVQCESRLQWHKNELKPVEKIEITRERYLPNPLDTWTDLVFRVEGGKKDGVIHVWADGKLIATAKGWIGHHISEGMKQYLKFGPYRDPAGYGFTVYLDNLATGGSYDEVDPARF
jgi:hypothetical protein